jgi:hypothetical protein
MMSVAGLMVGMSAALISASSAWADVDAGGHGEGVGARLTVDYDTGPLYVLQNDGRYGVAGTGFGAADVGQQDTLYRSQRASVELTLGDRHTLILLYAPLLIETRVTLDQDIMFRDTLFPQGRVVDHVYLFDGYRGSYLYGLLRGALDLDLGATLQIRNATVAFSSLDGALHDEENDIGLVFAVKTRLAYRPDETGPYGVFEADAFSTFGLVRNVDGAIYDLALTLGVPVSGPLDVVLRARLLGGGADVPAQAIDNYANILAFTAGVRIELDELW